MEVALNLLEWFAALAIAYLATGAIVIFFATLLVTEKNNISDYMSPFAAFAYCVVLWPFFLYFYITQR